MDELRRAGGVVETVAGRRRDDWSLASARLTHQRRRGAQVRAGSVVWTVRRWGWLRRRMSVEEEGGEVVGSYEETAWLRACGTLTVGAGTFTLAARRGHVRVREAGRELLVVEPARRGQVRFVSGHPLAADLEPAVLLVLAFIGIALLDEGPALRLRAGGSDFIGPSYGGTAGSV